MVKRITDKKAQQIAGAESLRKLGSKAGLFNGAQLQLVRKGQAFYAIAGSETQVAEITRRLKRGESGLLAFQHRHDPKKSQSRHWTHFDHRALLSC